VDNRGIRNAARNVTKVTDRENALVSRAVTGYNPRTLLM
jgi:hypothetical protein